jgi:hypothetical protein
MFKLSTDKSGNTEVEVAYQENMERTYEMIERSLLDRITKLWELREQLNKYTKGGKKVAKCGGGGKKGKGKGKGKGK